MQRDWDHVRTILLAVEDQIKTGPIQTISIQMDAPTFWYHLRILDDAGFINGEIHYHGESGMFHIIGLTWKGHELLDSIRDKTIWEGTKKRMSAVGGAGVEIIKALALDVIKKQLGLP